MKKESIILIGMAGVGKSTVGRLLAKRLDFDFTDLDELIFERSGKTTQEIIDSEGEQALLELEKQRMNEVDLNHRVIAPGGSIIYHSDLMKHLKQHATLIYLFDTFENIKIREKKRGVNGVVGLKNKSFKEVFNERSPLYSKYADITINTQDKSIEEIVKEIINSLI